MLFYLFAEELGVHSRRKRHERRAEAGRERADGIGYTALRARYLGGVARNEVEHRLFFGQFCNGREHAERVRGKEYDRLGVFADRRDDLIGNEVDGIGNARVLGERAVGVVGRAFVGIDDDVLDERAEAYRAVDLGLVLFAEVYALSIAAALDIEYAVVRPAVLVVADEPALGVGGERRFARAGKTEEQRGIAAAVERHIGGAVHAQHAFLRQQVVHEREYGLFHLARVLRADDEYYLALERKQYRRFAVGAALLGIELEPGHGDKRIILFERFELFFRRTDKHVVHEQVFGRVLVDDAYRNAVFGVCARKSVEYIDVFAAEVFASLFIDKLELVFRELFVLAAPAYLFRNALFVDYESVFGRTSGVRARLNEQRARVHEPCRLGLERLLGKQSRAEVALDFERVFDTVLFDSECLHICSFLGLAALILTVKVCREIRRARGA